MPEKKIIACVWPQNLLRLTEYFPFVNLSTNSTYHCDVNSFCLVQVASWRSATSDTGPPVIKWAPGSLMFATGSSELSFWIPDLSKLGSYVGRKQKQCMKNYCLPTNPLQGNIFTTTQSEKLSWFVNILLSISMILLLICTS